MRMRRFSTAPLLANYGRLVHEAAGAQKKQQELYGDLAECSFAPRTGRGPVSGSRAAAANLPAPVRLYANHGSKYKQVRLCNTAHAEPALVL